MYLSRGVAFMFNIGTTTQFSNFTHPTSWSERQRKFKFTSLLSLTMHICYIALDPLKRTCNTTQNEISSRAALETCTYVLASKCWENYPFMVDIVQQTMSSAFSLQRREIDSEL